jgi:hypothetical protein
MSGPVDDPVGNAGPSEKVLGVSVRGGQAYFALVCCPATPLLAGELDRITPSTQGVHATQLGNFRDRVSQELRRIQPGAVGVGFTRKYNNWAAEDAYTRFTLDAAVMLAAVDLNIECVRVSEEDAARAIGVPPKDLSARAAGALGVTPTKYWKERAWALAVALHVAQTRR